MKKSEIRQIIREEIQNVMSPYKKYMGAFIRFWLSTKTISYKLRK